MAPEDPDNSLISERESEEIHKRFFNAESEKKDWLYILEPITDPNYRSRMTILLQNLDNEDI